MTATAEPPVPATQVAAHPPLTRGEGVASLGRADGVELLGPVHGSGYRDGAALVRRADGQMVQLGPLMYALLECADGERDRAALAAAISERVGRKLDEEHVDALAQKLAVQGLLAGTEHKAPPKRNPLLALRWKVLVTDPVLTRRLTAPFTFLFSRWIMWPVLAGFAAVFWFVLFHKGVAGATAQAFSSPGLLVLVFALAVASAGFHELGHASACRYGGATPGGMGMGMYLVWPAFYTDVTDSYRLPKRDRLRVDLGGLYFNAVVADITMLVWLVWRMDALLLLVALQVLQMVKQLSPIIRADGYHILSDATGIPDLYSHMGPTLRKLLPGHWHEPSPITGWARVFVTAWVLIVVPVLMSLAIGAVLLLPKLATSSWESGRLIVTNLPHEVSHAQVLDVLASVVRLLALVLPVAGSVLVSHKIVRTTGGRALAWSRGRPVRRGVVLAGAGVAFAGIAWAWWPSGQYQPVRPTDGGTIGSLVRWVSAPTTLARPSGGEIGFVGPAATTPPQLTPGKHLAVAMVPVGGATKQHPALFVIRGGHGKPPVAILSTSAPSPSGVPTTGTSAGQSGTSTTTPTNSTPTASTPTTSAPPTGSSSAGAPTDANAFPFALPSAPGPGGTQAVATNTKDGGVVYDVAYALVTVTGGANVTNTNSAFALAHCKACTTVAVSFQLVLIVGSSHIIAPINAAGALNYNCPACMTTALADQIIVTLKAQPSQQLLDTLTGYLKQLNALPALGAAGTPSAVAAEVGTVQKEIDSALQGSGLEANPPNSISSSGSTSTTPAGTSSTTTPAPTTSTSSSSATTPAPTSSTPTSASPTGTSPTSTSTTPTSTPSTSTTGTTTTGTTTPAADSGTTSPTSTTP
jgi:putative peptide zinc metalloprotease protein